MDVSRRLIVVGANNGNLGDQIVKIAKISKMTRARWVVRGFDVSPDRGIDREYLDLNNRRMVVSALEDLSPTDIICTVGVNEAEDEMYDVLRSLEDHYLVNVIGPMTLLTEALNIWRRGVEPGQHSGFNFVVVSSNSAHVARSRSAGYCSSKAALSMAVRCVARREAGGSTSVWGYEPGFMSGTPMSDKTADQFHGQPLHRIPGGNSLSASDVAHQIVRDVSFASDSMNGCMIRIDGGEQ